MTNAAELPPGWVRVRLDEIAEVRLGRQRSPGNHTGEHMRPYLRAANVTWDGLDLTDVKEMNFNDEEVEVYRLQQGDILLSEASGSADEVGKPAIWRSERGEPMCFQNTLMRVRPAPGVLPEYLHLRLLHEAVSGGFARSSRGVGIHHLGAAKLSALNVELPPTAEQLRIVSLLEEHFSRIDAAATSVAETLRRVRRLQEATLVELLRDAGPATDRLGDLLREPLRNGLSARASSDPAGVRVLTLTAVTRRDFSARHTKVTSASRVKARGLWCQPGDIFVQRSNTPELVGSAAMYDGTRDFTIFPDLLIRVRVNERLHPRFAELILQAPQTRNHFRTHAQGLAGSMPKISQGTIAAVPMPVPSLTEQERLIEKVDAHLTSAQQAITGLEQMQKRCAALRRAVLAAAVHGRLTMPDPTDEPAVYLLKRYAEARAATATAGRRRARTVGRANVEAVEESA